MTLPDGFTLERLTALLVRGGIDPSTGERLPAPAPVDPLDFLPCPRMNLEALED